MKGLGLACATLVLALPLAAAAQGWEYRVRINAPRALETLLEDNLDLVRFRSNPRMDRDQLQRMLRAAPEQVKTLVATAGYYTPAVNISLDESGTPTVTLDVQPGDPVLVGEVTIDLAGFASTPAAPFDQQALKASWGLPAGAVFRQDEWEKAKRDILRAVVQTRYPRAQLTASEAVVDPETRRALLHITLDSGPEMRFGELKVEGLRRYPESVVSNLNPVKPGDYYSEAALQAFQGKLQETGYFANVEVSADLSAVLDEQIAAAEGKAQGAPQPATMPPLPLLVRVVENKRKNASVGIGFSTNTGARASGTYDDLSVFGLKMKSALTLETKRQSARSDFYFPTTADGYNDSFGAVVERKDIEGEITRTALVAAKRAWGTPLLERSISIEYLNESKTVNRVLSTHSQSLPITYAATWRKVDNLVFPTKGYVVNATLGGALLPVLTDEKFIRATARGITYRPLSTKSTVILRAEIGALASASQSGVPTTYLFRAGGDNSVRGYAYQELGVQQGDATVGGRYLVTGSAEYQYWFKPTWGAAVFYDAGNAGNSVSGLAPKSGYGVGARYKSPVGPINVDIAYGHAIRKARVHFSLGFTF